MFPGFGKGLELLSAACAFSFLLSLALKLCRRARVSFIFFLLCSDFQWADADDTVDQWSQPGVSVLILRSSELDGFAEVGGLPGNVLHTSFWRCLGSHGILK